MEALRKPLTALRDWFTSFLPPIPSRELLAKITYKPTEEHRQKGEELTSGELRCPICDSQLDRVTAKKLSLDPSSIELIHSKAQDGTLVRLLELGLVAEQFMEPSKLDVETKVLKLFREMEDRHNKLVEDIAEAGEKERKKILEDYMQEHGETEKEREVELKQIYDGLDSIRLKVVGTGIGKIGEQATIIELQGAFPQDEFSDKRSDEKGADIVADVRDEGTSIGKIVVSVKYHEKWSGEFLRQLRENVQEEGAQWGLLVTRVFPSNALNERAHLTKDGYFLVKPEYASVAFYGLREALKVRCEFSRRARDAEEVLQMRNVTISVIQEWVEGKKFEELVNRLRIAREAAESAQKLVRDWQKYSKNTGDKIFEKNQNVIDELINNDELIAELKLKLREKPNPITSQNATLLQ